MGRIIDGIKTTLEGGAGAVLRVLPVRHIVIIYTIRITHGPLHACIEIADKWTRESCTWETSRVENDNRVLSRRAIESRDDGQMPARSVERSGVGRVVARWTRNPEPNTAHTRHDAYASLCSTRSNVERPSRSIVSDGGTGVYKTRPGPFVRREQWTPGEWLLNGGIRET